MFDACEIELPDVETGPNRTLTGVVNERARGLAGARNTGILLSKHGFVAFLDDDDTWLPRKLDAQMAVFAEHPEVGLVGTAMLVDDGRTTHERPVPLIDRHAMPTSSATGSPGCTPAASCSAATCWSTRSASSTRICRAATARTTTSCSRPRSAR